MGNSSGCCTNSSEALIKKGDQDLNSLNQINNKNNENTKLVNEIESKSNTNEVTNNNNIHNKNNPNNIPSAQKHSDFIKDLNKNNLNEVNQILIMINKMTIQVKIKKKFQKD